MATYASLLKSVHSNITSYQDIATIYRKLDEQRVLVQLAELLNQIFAEEHDFTVKELSKYVQESGAEQSEEEFLEEQYELNSNIFRKNLALITSNMVEEIGKLYIQRFKDALKKDGSPAREASGNGRSLAADKIQYRNELPEIREENEERGSPATGRHNTSKDEPKSSRNELSNQKSQEQNLITETEEPVPEPESVEPTKNLEQNLSQVAKVIKETPKTEEKVAPVEKKQTRYGTTPEKEEQINAMLAQRYRNMEERSRVQGVTPQRTFDLREIQSRTPVTQDGAAYEYPVYAYTTSDSQKGSQPNSQSTSNVPSTLNSANRQYNNANPYQYPVQYVNKRLEDKFNDQAMNRDRSKSSQRSGSTENLGPRRSQATSNTLNIPQYKESSRGSKSPSDKFRKTNSSSSPNAHSFSRYSNLSNGPDPSILDSEFSYTKGQTFSKSKRKLHDDPAIKPGPGYYQIEEGEHQIMRSSPKSSFGKAAKKTIFATASSEGPGHIYYPTQHFLSKPIQKSSSEMPSKI